MVNILGTVQSACLDQALAWSKIHLPELYHNIIKDYKEHGERYNVRWDWAFAQACHETGLFKFGGDVKMEQNNFAGLGTIGNGEPGDSFDSISAGVLGQIQHLASYAGKDIPQGELVAPRTKTVKNIILGKTETWEGLAGTWAADKKYFDRLQYHYNRIFQPREQDPGWYRLVEQGGQKFFVAMCGGDAIFKYPVKDHTLSALSEACNSLLKAFPDARKVHSDKPMDISEVPEYTHTVPPVPPPQTGRVGNNTDTGSSRLCDSVPKTEPAYFWRRSPNQSQRNNNSKITHIILHNTAGSFWGAVSWLTNPRSRASAHVVIPRSGGEIAALVDERNAAWHAGSSRWNRCSIGIEIEATEAQRGMTPAQEKLVVQQINYLLDKYNLPPDKIDIHRRVSRIPLPATPTSDGRRGTDCPSLIWPTDSDFLAWRRKWYGV